MQIIVSEGVTLRTLRTFVYLSYQIYCSELSEIAAQIIPDFYLFGINGLGNILKRKT